jgi:hypothetical protein
LRAHDFGGVAFTDDRVDVEAMKGGLTRAPSPNKVWFSLFVGDLAVAHRGLRSTRLVDVDGLSIENCSGFSFRRFTFFTGIETEWRLIS